MSYEKQDYRQVILGEFERRNRVNQRYSLRAFARDLQVSAARLSEVMNGKKGLSRAAAEKIGTKLGLEKNELEVFCDLVEGQHGRAKTTRDSARLRLKKKSTELGLHTLKLDEFSLISDWYHLAILQLIDTKDFQSDIKWIAGRLKISITQARAAIELLERMELIERRGKKIVALKELVTTPDVPSAAIRNNHRQIRTKGLEALETQTIDERDFSSIQLPIDSSEILRAKEMIREFRRKFCAEFSRAKSKDSVYCLSVDFFNLTPKK